MNLFIYNFVDSYIIINKRKFYIDFILNKRNQHNVEKSKKICYTTKCRKYTAVSKKEGCIMWVIVITLLMFFGVFYALFRLAWAISKPIFVYLYEKIVNTLMQQGMSEQAAKALISAIAILLIVIIALCSY